MGYNSTLHKPLFALALTINFIVIKALFFVAPYHVLFPQALVLLLQQNAGGGGGHDWNIFFSVYI